MSEFRLFGLRAESARWILVASGLITTICLGSIYAYSVIRVPLEELFTAPPPRGYGLNVTSTEMQLPYLILLLLDAIMKPVAGKFINTYGVRIVALSGAILFGLAWLLSPLANSPLTLVFIYGIIGGLGVGLAALCPVAVAASWFPDKRGLAVGVTLIGLGSSAAIIGPLVDILAAGFGVKAMFWIIGTIFLILMVSSALLMRLPPDGWMPSGWELRTREENIRPGLRTGEVVKTRVFYSLWICYTIGALAGLMAIGVSKQVGFEVAEAAGIDRERISPTLTALVSFFAICNGLGRPLFGWITDKLGPRGAAVISFASILTVSLAIYAMPSSIPVYILTFAVLWLNLGGWLAIAPTATAQFFGMNNYAQNYGVVFTAYGAGALIGNLLAGQIKDILGSYLLVFPIIAILSILGMITALALKTPETTQKKKR